MINKDQYKAYGEFSQLIYDGGQIRNQVEMENFKSVAEKNQLATDLYKLRERINQLCFGILFSRLGASRYFEIQSEPSNITGVERLFKKGLIITARCAGLRIADLHDL